MKNLVTLSIEEFLSLYNCANRGADFDECNNALQKLYGREFFTLSSVQAMLQFAKYINEKNPHLKAVVDQLNTEMHVSNSKDDPLFKSDVEAYVRKAKELIKSSAVVVDKLSYNGDLILKREDVISSF